MERSRRNDSKYPNLLLHHLCYTNRVIQFTNRVVSSNNRVVSYHQLPGSLMLNVEHLQLQSTRLIINRVLR